MLCNLTLCMSGGIYNLKVDAERQIFKQLLARNLLRVSRQRNIFYI